MRSALFLISAALVASASAHADIYLSLEQAQESLFPGASFTQDFRSLTDRQVEEIITEAQVTVWNRQVKAWRVSSGGWFVIDQVLGRDDWITYAVAINDDGIVVGVEVLECLERWNQVTLPEWRAQFLGKRRGKLALAGDIITISGTTLSSDHITEGVRRVLATMGRVYGIPQA